MPEDCLLEIFSMKTLDLMDMCSIAETCKRFRSIIIERIIGKTICFRCERYSSFKTHKLKHETDNRSDIETIFRNFGSCFSTVLAFGNDKRQENFLFRLIKLHCKDVLKSLCIIHMRIPATISNDLRPVFKRLSILSLSSVTNDANKSTFEGLDSLANLEVCRVKNDCSILENTFTQLESFTYLTTNVVTAEQCSESENQDHQSLENILSFLKRHSGLRSLDIDVECDQNCWMFILKTIGDSCTKLHKLTIGTGCDWYMYSSVLLQPLQKLKSLKSMKLTGVSFEDFQVFSSLTDLRELELQLCVLPRDAEQFGCLAQVTSLSLIGSEPTSGDFDMADIVRHLVNLVNFVALKLFSLDVATLTKIVSIVKERSNVLTLVCTCDFSVNSEEAFQKSNGRIIVRAEDRYFSSYSFGSIRK